MGTLGAVRFFSIVWSPSAHPLDFPPSDALAPWLHRTRSPWHRMCTLSECLFFFGIYSFHCGGHGRPCLPIFGGGNAILPSPKKHKTSLPGVSISPSHNCGRPSMHVYVCVQVCAHVSTHTHTHTYQQIDIRVGRHKGGGWLPFFAWFFSPSAL